jgi:hypothetical protein
MKCLFGVLSWEKAKAGSSEIFILPWNVICVSIYAIRREVASIYPYTNIQAIGYLRQNVNYPAIPIFSNHACYCSYLKRSVSRIFNYGVSTSMDTLR